jgi:hypothetical protein
MLLAKHVPSFVVEIIRFNERSALIQNDNDTNRIRKSEERSGVAGLFVGLGEEIVDPLREDRSKPWLEQIAARQLCDGIDDSGERDLLMDERPAGADQIAEKSLNLRVDVLVDRLLFDDGRAIAGEIVRLLKTFWVARPNERINAIGKITGGHEALETLFQRRPVHDGAL